MSVPRILPSFILLACTAVGASAQWDLHFDPAIPVTKQGALLDLAWTGGINYAQISEIDLNGDGLRDLLIFDHSYSFPSGHKAVMLLRTSAMEGTAHYRPLRDYDHVPPLDRLHDWALARDYNCDGKADICSYTQAGFGVWKNTGDNNGLAFEPVKSLVYSAYVSPNGAQTDANLFISQVDLPGIEDIDGDGDLDVITFSLLGTYVEYHKNLSMEAYGTCDSLKFEQRNKCWGYFAENFNNNSVTLNVPCQFNVPNPELRPEGTTPADDESDDRAHAGSTITPIDLDGDGDKDLLLGDISFTNLVALSNGGTVLNANMTGQDTLFPSYDVSVDMPIFPSAFYVDVDRDGRRDLLVTPNAGSLSHDFRSVWYYRNVGTDAAPVLDFQQQDLFQDRMIELGLGAIPVAFDEDGDGRMDLIVSNHGYYETGGSYVGKVALLRNTGSATSPSFELVTDDWLGLSASGIGLSMHPAFGDVDGDGDLDLYIGDLQGRLHFYRNTATGPQSQFVLQQVNVTDAGGTMIDVGQFAAPIFHDLDEDGLLDLIIGERNGNLNHYRNTGSAANPAWTLVSEALGGVSTVEWINVTGHSAPHFLTNDQGERELLLGSESGAIYHYGNIDGNVDGAWTLLDTAWRGIDDGARTVLCLHDFTGDGQLDLVVGNYRGGLSFWRSDQLSTVAGTVSMAGAFSLFPNPATDHAVIVAEAVPQGTSWVLYDAVGQELQRGTINTERFTIALNGLAEGLYMVRLGNGPYSAAQRLIIQR
ncbi:MAG: T9SS type A sorting domain-containing protein [Flavobacteriales bacterium]|nr:T9SS type A sorting domain-containing protein [Flavobacteriales bacterium]